MVMDNKGRLFGKINVIDFLIIVLVFSAVGGIGYKFSKSKTSVLAKTTHVSIEFFTDEAPTFAVNKIKTGDIVGDTERGSTFGKVEVVNIDKSVSLGQTFSGQFVESSKPGLSSVRMQVYGEGELNTDGGIKINNIDYYIGKSIILKAGNSVFMGRIYDLSKRG